MMYADFDCQKTIEVKIQMTHVACSYGHKLVRVDDKFSQPFNSSLDEDNAYSFTNSMIE